MSKSMKLYFEHMNSNSSKESINLLVKELSHKNLVRFALYCAQDSLQYYDSKKFPKQYKDLTNCLELIGTWLLDHNKVSIKELHAAANAAFAAGNAAFDTANAANAAASAAFAAANAAFAAANAAYADKQKQYLLYLIELLLNEKNINYNSLAVKVLYGPKA